MHGLRHQTRNGSTTPCSDCDRASRSYGAWHAGALFLRQWGNITFVLGPPRAADFEQKKQKNTVSGLLLWPLYASCNRHRKQQQQQQQQSVQQRTPSAHPHLEHSDLIERVQGQDPGYQQHNSTPPDVQRRRLQLRSGSLPASGSISQPISACARPVAGPFPPLRSIHSTTALFDCIRSKYAWQTSKMPSGCLTQYTGYCAILIGPLDWMARLL